MHANAIIIGSHLKAEDRWHNELEATQVQTFMSTVQELRVRQDEEEKDGLEVSKVETADVLGDRRQGSGQSRCSST